MVKTEKKSKEKTKIVKDLTVQLLGLMGVEVGIEISEDEENDATLINIQAEKEAGLLIGARGRTINSIQSLLGIMFRRKTGEWRRIIVNVADWRQREISRLKELALQAAERARTTDQPQHLYNLLPSQRRIIHLELADDKEIKTESVGEGKERYLIISRRQ